ncbi:hypothetical protein L3Q67_23365 [Saccharothrix sp. AJ9571]|nr:hypothetical protein L3Q67_23365 [Saccharothrix sp. AJ9571]
MTEWPAGATRNKLLLSFAWPVPMATREAEVVFRPNRELLEPLTGKPGTDWSVAEGFLTTHTEQPSRYRFTTPLAIGEGDAKVPCGLTATWHPAYHATTLLITATISGRGGVLETSDVDRTIAVLHSLNRRPAELGEAPAAVHGWYRDVRYPSLRAAVAQAYAELTDGCDVVEPLDRNGWCIELRGYDGRPPDATVAADPRPFYGLAHGDEGWRFVPHEVARQSLGEAWGTRTFVAMYPVSAGIVCLNNKGDEYSAHQAELAQRYFGKAEPYFGLDSEIGGLDHGGLLVLERVLIRMALAHQWLHQAQRELAEATDESRAVNRNRLLRFTGRHPADAELRAPARSGLAGAAADHEHGRGTDRAPTGPPSGSHGRRNPVRLRKHRQRPGHPPHGRDRHPHRGHHRPGHPAGRLHRIAGVTNVASGADSAPKATFVTPPPNRHQIRAPASPNRHPATTANHAPIPTSPIPVPSQKHGDGLHVKASFPP